MPLPETRGFEAVGDPGNILRLHQHVEIVRGTQSRRIPRRQIRPLEERVAEIRAGEYPAQLVQPGEKILRLPPPGGIGRLQGVPKFPVHPSEQPLLPQNKTGDPAHPVVQELAQYPGKVQSVVQQPFQPLLPAVEEAAKLQHQRLFFFITRFTGFTGYRHGDLPFFSHVLSKR